MNIRKYQVTDKQNLQKICVMTAIPQKSEHGKTLLNLLYNDYYTEQEPDNCFVLTNDKDIAVGYIICAEDFYQYKKTFNQIYMPKIKKLSLAKYLMKKASFIIEGYYANKYPAHLHIDIDSDFTGKGSGSMLMNALLNHLKDKNVKGIMLCVGAKNVRAIDFYTRHGFTRLLSKVGCVFMGRDIL